MTKGSGSDGNGGNKPPKDRSTPETARTNNVLPIDRGRRVVRHSWTITPSGFSLNSGAGLLIVIGVLCGLVISESDKKSLIATPSPHTPAQRQAAVPIVEAKPAKPSPDILAGAAKPAAAAAEAHALPAPRPAKPSSAYTAVKFEATHKKVFGGCTGELELTNSALRFRCAKQGDLDFPVGEIAKANKDGVILKSGEKYHFAIANHTKDQAEAIFVSWLSKVQPGSQQNSTF